MKVYFDRYGYVSGFGKDGEAGDVLLRRCSNLSADANLAYATGHVADVPDDFDIQANDEAVAARYKG